MPRYQWVQGVLAAWNAVTAALHTIAGINIYEPVRMPWGAVLARIEHIYLTDKPTRALVDEAIKQITQ